MYASKKKIRKLGLKRKVIDKRAYPFETEVENFSNYITEEELEHLLRNRRKQLHHETLFENLNKICGVLLFILKERTNAKTI